MTDSNRHFSVSPTTLAMLFADARLPVGGHVSSAGLEPALAAGMPPERARDYLVGRARTVSMVEAGTAVVARHVALDAADAAAVADRLLAVEAAWAARTPSLELRTVSRSLARGHLRLAERLWPGHPAITAGRSTNCSRPVALGALAAAAGLDAEGVVRLVVYDDAQTAAAALLKLAPIDPAVPVGWVLEACEAVDDLVALVAALTSPDAIPATGAPQNEEWAEAHSGKTQRLFRA
jgi:urease accessory protein